VGRCPGKAEGKKVKKKYNIYPKGPPLGNQRQQRSMRKILSTHEKRLEKSLRTAQEVANKTNPSQNHPYSKTRTFAPGHEGP